MILIFVVAKLITQLLDSLFGLFMAAGCGAESGFRHSPHYRNRRLAIGNRIYGTRHAFPYGACLARTGFDRKTAYATLAMTLAAGAPDMDVFWWFRAP